MDSLKLNKEILEILLIDRTKETNKIKEKNIIWATDNYKKFGVAYNFEKEIKIELINNGNVIKPRIQKSKDEQQKRAREKAEVFTPSWICNAQNNLLDEQFFGRENVFNVEMELEKTWKTNYEKIKFPSEENLENTVLVDEQPISPNERNWKIYVGLNQLEITCGEAPYLTSRYDTTTGNFIEVKNRIGLLDRKLRIVNENIETKEDWIKWATVAVQSIYGFEWQGDNLLIARENLLFTVIEHYFDKFNEELDEEQLINFAKIISWNIWQMDGLKFVIPNSCVATKKNDEQLSLFEEFEEKKVCECEGCKKKKYFKHTGIYCKIMDWKVNEIIRFVDMLKKEGQNG